MTDHSHCNLLSLMLLLHHVLIGVWFSNLEAGLILLLVIKGNFFFFCLFSVICWDLEMQRFYPAMYKET